MKELLKRQTQNEFLKLLQSKKSRRKADELTEEDIMELAAALHKSDAESGTLVMLNVIITVDEYAQWLEEVVQVLRKR